MLFLTALCADAVQRKPVPIEIFLQSYFFSSAAIADGAVQLSKCALLNKQRLGRYPNFTCLPSGEGYRCTSDPRLDVAFVYRNSVACVRRRNELLDAEEKE